MEAKEIIKAAKKIFDEVAAVDGKLVVAIEIKDPARDAYAGDMAISTLMLIERIRRFEHAIGRLVKIVAIDDPEKKRPNEPLVQYVTKSGLAILGPCAELVGKKGPVMRYAVLDVGIELPDMIAKPPEKALKKIDPSVCPVNACGEEFDYKACESYRKKEVFKISKRLYLKCVLCRYHKRSLWSFYGATEQVREGTHRIARRGATRYLFHSVLAASSPTRCWACGEATVPELHPA